MITEHNPELERCKRYWVDNFDIFHKPDTVIVDSLSEASNKILAGTITRRMLGKDHIEEIEPKGYYPANQLRYEHQLAAYEQAMQVVWDKKYPYKATATGIRPENIPGDHASIVVGPPWARKRRFWFQTWTERDVFCKEYDGAPL